MKMASKLPRAVTQFENKVYSLCKKIPMGKVATYGSMARSLGMNSGARAIGQAMRRNPFAPHVPCHRVISSDLKLGGFYGQWGKGELIAKKRELLSLEGVQFVGDVISSNCLVDFSKLGIPEKPAIKPKNAHRAAPSVRMPPKLFKKSSSGSMKLKR